MVRRAPLGTLALAALGTILLTGCERELSFCRSSAECPPCSTGCIRGRCEPCVDNVGGSGGQGGGAGTLGTGGMGGKGAQGGEGGQGGFAGHAAGHGGTGGMLGVGGGGAGGKAGMSGAGGMHGGTGGTGAGGAAGTGGHNTNCESCGGCISTCEAVTCNDVQLVGTPGTCDAYCVTVPRGCIHADGCCSDGCASWDDGDCCTTCAPWEVDHRFTQGRPLGLWGMDQDLWATGESFLMQRTKSGWVDHDVPSGAVVYGVWGATPQDIWIATSAGPLRFDGKEVHASDLLQGGRPRAVHGSGTDDVWWVGDTGHPRYEPRVWRWNGATVEDHTENLDQLSLNIIAVWVAAPQQVWLLTQVSVYQRLEDKTGQTLWATLPSPTADPFLVAMAGPPLHVAQATGEIYRWNSGTWMNVEDDLFGAGPFAVAGAELWAGGSNGRIIKLGSPQEDWELPFPHAVVGLWAGEDILWALGASQQDGHVILSIPH